jgi:hypothetical protein
MSVIYSRASWGPRYSNGATDNNGNPIIIGTKTWKRVYVHHSVTAVPGGAKATLEQERQHMRDLEGIGERSFGQGISYTVLVFPSGRAHQGHDLDRRGAHTYQLNDAARAICFVGNFENEQPTDAALKAAGAVLAEWKAAGLPHVITGGHRDVFATACPGRNLYSRLSQITTANGGSAPQEDNDMQLTDRMKNAFGTEPTVREVFAAIDLNSVNAANNTAKLVGLAEQQLAATKAQTDALNRLAGVVADLNLKGQTQEQFDAAYRQSNLTKDLVREGQAYRISDDQPNGGQ